MKAAVLNAFGAPLAIQTLPDPVLGTGEVIVDIVATAVTSYVGDVFSGARNYMPERTGVGSGVAPACSCEHRRRRRRRSW